MSQKLLVLALLTFFPAAVATATNYTSPVPEPFKETTVGGYLALSSIPMETDTGSDDISRTILGGTYSSRLSGESAFAVGFGYAINAEAAGGFKGNGFNFAGSYVRLVHHSKKMLVFGYGGFEYLIEGYKGSVVTADLSYMGLKGGASLLYPLSKKLRPYAALELFLLNSGTFKVGAFSADIKRDSIFSLRGGVQYLVTKDIYVRPELALVGEQTFLVAVGKDL